jgi:hypothetical protein
MVNLDGQPAWSKKCLGKEYRTPLGVSVMVFHGWLDYEGSAIVDGLITWRIYNMMALFQGGER